MFWDVNNEHRAGVCLKLKISLAIQVSSAELVLETVNNKTNFLIVAYFCTESTVCRGMISKPVLIMLVAFFTYFYHDFEAQRSF